MRTGQVAELEKGAGVFRKRTKVKVSILAYRLQGGRKGKGFITA